MWPDSKYNLINTSQNKNKQIGNHDPFLEEGILLWFISGISSNYQLFQLGIVIKKTDENHRLKINKTNVASSFSQPEWAFSCARERQNQFQTNLASK